MGGSLLVQKIQETAETLCDFGCGSTAKWLLGKKTPRPCCSTHFQRCPRRIAQSPLKSVTGELGRSKNHTPEDLSKQKFGRLAPKRVHTRGPVVWECLCDCGKTTYVRASALVNHNTKSCGCYRDELVGNITRKRPYEWVYTNFKRTCGKEVAISLEQFLTLVQIKKCHYCDIEIPWSCYANKCKAYYLDRKDTLKGYTMDNVVVCCTRCNIGKSRFFSYEEWVEIGKLIKTMRERKMTKVAHAA